LTLQIPNTYYAACTEPGIAMEAQQHELTRRDRNKSRNRREILDAALAVFAAKGYHQASMQAIADRADFAVSTLYALFENKEDIYTKVSARVGRECGAIFDDAMAKGKDPYERLVNFARAKAEVWRVCPDGIRMLENELHAKMLGDTDPPPNGIAEIYDRFLLRIEDLFAQGIKAGQFVDAPPAILALSLDSATSTLMRKAAMAGESAPSESGLDKVIRVFFGPVLVDGGKAQANA
jgi:TetR/AcrR family transcriptional regulator